MQTNPAAEQSKIIRWSESLWNQSGRKEKGLWRKGFAEEPSLSLVWPIESEPKCQRMLTKANFQCGTTFSECCTKIQPETLEKLMFLEDRQVTDCSVLPVLHVNKTVTLVASVIWVYIN